MRWPRDRYEVQVLDDSTDDIVRAAVDEEAALWRSRGVDCRVIRREDRVGYKAGALEAGRKQTSAELLALFDADFVPPPDFLSRVVPHFYAPDRSLLADVALVQAQWSHLNMSESLLTLAQSLWIDDHHTSQMHWRSDVWEFVNFTGTAGVWQAAAIARAGGWRATSLVEDCELSFRVLFTGRYRTRFVAVPVVAELPNSVRAYKAQQKRWTMGWAQLICLHLGTLLFKHRCSGLKRLHLLYHMLLSIQWPLWFLWQVTTPWLLATLDPACYDDTAAAAASGELWHRSNRQHRRCSPLLAYLWPLLLHMILSSVIAASELCDGGAAVSTWPRLHRVLRFGVLVGRALPCAILSAGMLPHQTCAWFEGLLTENAEFETTPKSGSVGGGVGSVAVPARAARIHWYVVVELLYVLYHLGWLVRFAWLGDYHAAASTLLPMLAVATLCLGYVCDGACCWSWRCSAPVDCGSAPHTSLACTGGRPAPEGLKKYRAPLLDNEAPACSEVP